MRRSAVVSLIHSPLVGPSSWAAIAAESSERGVVTCVPDLRHAAEHVGTTAAVVATAAEALPSEVQILVGHSGAGVLLPAIAEAANGDVAGFVFVDAHLPPTEGRVALAEPEFERFLSSLAHEDRLPPWSRWWGAEAMAKMVPDADVRRALEREMPSLPLAYFQQQLEAVHGWTTQPCGYVRLSELYEPNASAAEQRGWPVERFSAGHLHGVVDPVAVTDALLNIIEAMDPTDADRCP